MPVGSSFVIGNRNRSPAGRSDRPYGSFAVTPCEWQPGCTCLAYVGSRPGLRGPRTMIFRPIERWIAGIRAPLEIKLQFGFFVVIGVLLLTGVVSLLAIAEIREHAHHLDRLDESVHRAQ